MFYLVNYFPDSHALCSAYDGALALSLARPLNRCLSAPTHRHRSASPHFYTRAPPFPKWAGLRLMSQRLSTIFLK